MLSSRRSISSVLALAAGLAASVGLPFSVPAYASGTSAAPPRRRSSVPFSSDRQHRRHAKRQYMVVVNGFEIMNTAPAGGSPQLMGLTSDVNSKEFF